MPPPQASSQPPSLLTLSALEIAQHRECFAILALKANQPAIEEAFGGPLEWRSRDADGLMKKVAKVVTPKVWIGSRTEPTTEGLQGLADTARRLVKAVEPYLRGCYDSASLAIVESEAADDVGATEIVEPVSDDEVADVEVVSHDGSLGRAPV